MRYLSMLFSLAVFIGLRTSAQNTNSDLATARTRDDAPALTGVRTQYGDLSNVHTRHSHSSRFKSYKGLVMAGYQGWHDTPEDGAGRGWGHYLLRGQFGPGNCKFDLWPEEKEYPQLYKTPFTHADGTTAMLPSDNDASTTDLRFKWMRQYGVDGVFMQRFIGNVRQYGVTRNHFNKVLADALAAARKYGRAISVMYDLSGMRDSIDVPLFIRDWENLVDSMKITGGGNDQPYLYHNGKPLVVLWGVGFSGRDYTLRSVERIIDFLKNDPVYGHCAVMLGLPTYWRQAGNDADPDPHVLEVIKKVDVIHPWTVGRYRTVDGYDKYSEVQQGDLAWCRQNNVDYAATVFPGFSWSNLNPRSTFNEIPRDRGNFYWMQLANAIKNGARMIYVAMFDEVDEGTAIMKISPDPPVGASRFVTFEPGIPSDYYLYLTGYAAKMLRKEIPFQEKIPLPVPPAANPNASTAPRSPTDYVDPFIGTSNHGDGRTIPGAITPFGMVQVNPNTITGGDNGQGYIYENEYIEGFAFTQMSGIGWYGDLGNLLTTPTNGPLQLVAGRHPEWGKGYRSHYTKADEIAKPGYYAATLTDYDTRVEATAAPHSGMLRFTFPANERSRIQIDLARRCGGTSVLQYIRIVDEHSIEGWMKCTPDGGGWGDGAGHADYTVYFYASFSKPLKNFGVWSAGIPDGISRKRQSVMSAYYDSLISRSKLLPGCTEQAGKHLGFYTEFPTQPGEIVVMKAGISFSSLAGAKDNLLREIPAWDFDAVVTNAQKAWNNQLSKMTVTGGTADQRTVFYTALYHTMMDPRTITDLNGDYPGADHQVHKAVNFTRTSIFSGWDVFRSQFPLQTIINPGAVGNMISSLVDMADRSGNHYLERWELLNAYSGCMVGNPAVVVLTDAYNKGIRNFDIAAAYRTAKLTVDKFGNGQNFRIDNDDISKTLEYSFSEWCLANLAASLGKKEDAVAYSQLAKSYRNVFDPGVGWFRPRNTDGSWRPWPLQGRLQQSYGCVESNPYQQGWFVPQDIPGLAQLLGGRERTIAILDSFFEQTPKDLAWNNFYNQSNEPVHLVPFMFNRLGAPWLTQKWVRMVAENGYRNSISGLVGNEDVGQMSAWFVLAASGFHQACPGDTRYELFSPLFDTITIYAAATGNTFTVVAKDNSPENVYIQSASLNGKPYSKCHIDHRDILNGGKLELVLGPKPNKNWGLE